MRLLLLWFSQLLVLQDALESVNWHVQCDAAEHECYLTLHFDIMQNQNKRKRCHLSNGARDAESDVDSTDISLHEEEEDDFNVEHNVRPARLSLGGNSNLIVSSGCI
jgi:hypothetical protein